MRFYRFMALLVLVFFVARPLSASAQGSARTSSLSIAAINSFLSNPGQLLNTFPTGGQGLTLRTQEYLAAEKSTLAPLIKLLQSANKEQQNAMATGLFQAAKAYAASDQPFATEIQTAVAATGIEEVIKAYASAAGDTGTATTGGGGAGGGGGGPTASTTPSGGNNSGTFNAASGGVPSPSNQLAGPLTASSASASNLLTGATTSSTVGSPVSTQ
jgi:hypothetical protein